MVSNLVSRIVGEIPMKSLPQDLPGTLGHIKNKTFAKIPTKGISLTKPPFGGEVV